MKTVAIEKSGDPSCLVDKEMPLPKPKRHEVRIKIKAVGFNPVDCKIRKGLYGEVSYPHVLGAECSGIVDAVGEEFHEFSVGDEVYAFCFFQGSNGAYAEYVCLPIQFVAKKPKNLSFEEAATSVVTYLTAFQALISTGAFQENRPFFIAGGSGGVGSATLSLAKVYHAGPIFTTAGSEKSQDYLVSRFQIPKSQILSYTGLSLDEMTQKLTSKGKFYLALDFVGGTMKQLCFSVTDCNSHIVSILPEEKDFPIPIWGRKSPFFQMSQSLHLVFLGAEAMSNREEKWMAYKSRLNHLTHLFENENLLPPAIEHLGSFSAKTVQKAHQLLEEGHTKGKLVMSHSIE